MSGAAKILDGVKCMSLKLGRSKGRRTLDKVEGFSTCVGENTIFRGSIFGHAHCIVHGKVEGDCDLEGTLVIGDTGSWIGNIKAHTVLIAGRVEGDIYATAKMEIVSTARIKGKIISSTLAIAEGAIHEGQIQMTSGKQEVHFVQQRGPDYEDITIDGGKQAGSKSADAA